MGGIVGLFDAAGSDDSNQIHDSFNRTRVSAESLARLPKMPVSVLKTVIIRKEYRGRQRQNTLEELRVFSIKAVSKTHIPQVVFPRWKQLECLQVI